MKQLQVHFTYNINGNEVQDFYVVQSKTKRYTCGQQLMDSYKIAKQLNLKHADVKLTHYFVC